MKEETLEFLAIKIAETSVECDRVRKEYPNSYGHGYEAGYLQALRDTEAFVREQTS